MQSNSLTNTTGIIFIILGLLSIAYPFYTSLGIETFFGAMFLIGGIFQLFGAFETKQNSSFIWGFLIGILYIIAGVYLLSHPLIGLVFLTIILIGLFYAQGVLMVIFSLQHRTHSEKWGWALLNGLTTIAIATILMLGYPLSSLWAFGLLTGINLLMFGVSILMVNQMTKKVTRS